MRKRMGFISNSSSSSFVLLFPENFNVRDVLNEHFEEISDYIEECNLFKIKSLDDSGLDIIEQNFNKFLNEGSSEYHNSEIYSLLSEFIYTLFGKYVVTQISVSSDDGSIVCLDINKVKNLLKDSKNEN